MLKELFSNFPAADLMPHGNCLLWRPEILTLHVISDATIALSYYSIPLALIYFVSKRNDLRFRGMFVLFGLFILACGTTHAMEVWTIWVPDYVLSGWIKAVTALVSMAAAISLWPLIPAALSVPSPARLEEANRLLQREVEERKQTEERVRQLNDDLERLVELRTAELTETNRRLEAEVAERSRAEECLRESEHLYRTLFEQMPDSVVLVDPTEGRIADCNEQAFRSLGYDQAGFRQLTLADIEARESRDEIDAHIEHIRQAGEDTFETRHRAADGSLRDVRVSSKMLRIRDRDLIQAIFSDISAYKRLEEALLAQQDELRQSRQRLQYILDASPAAVYILKPPSEETQTTLRTLFCTESISAIAGYTPAEWYREDSFWIDRLHPADREAAIQSQQTLFTTGALTHEYRFRHRDGSYRWIHDQMVAARDARGRIVEVIGTWIDVTGIKRVEQELAGAKEAAEAANRAKTQFLAHISHELRTPMNCILGFTQILQRDPALGDSHHDHLESIRRAGNHLQALISDLLDLARIESGHLELHEVNFDLRECLDSLTSMFELRSRQKGIEFRFIQTGTPLETVFGDDKHLRQILINLLSNAVKFTTQGHVDLRAGYDGGWCCFAIEDTGPGIDPADLERIFAPFEQLEYHASPEGTGLGLAITRRLVDAMSGEIRVSSRIGEGTVFTVRLPLPATFTSPKPTPAEPASPAGHDVTAQRILVADDNPDNRMVMQAALESMGFVVECASDGVECLRRNREFHPDLILLDLVMPGMDGLETLSRLRSEDAEQRARIIAVTANAFEETRRECLVAGFDDFITKPVDLDDLFARVTENLQNRGPGTAAPG